MIALDGQRRELGRMVRQLAALPALLLAALVAVLVWELLHGDAGEKPFYVLVAGALLGGVGLSISAVRQVRRLSFAYELALAEARERAALLAEERRQLADAERRRAAELERAVADRTRELLHLNRELEAFSYSVSHDLRAPVRALAGFAQALEEEYAARLDGAGLDYLGRIRAASRRMSMLIDDLLQLSRVSRAELRRQKLDLSALVREVADEVQEREPGRPIAWRIQPGVECHADARLLRVALVNLLENAAKFTRPAPAPRVEFEVRDGPEGRSYLVRDNGAGFDMAYAGRLFQPFQRLHGPEEFEGTGVGLATLQRIVHRHGGRAWAEGQPGRGATFHFTLGEVPSPGAEP